MWKEDRELFLLPISTDEYSQYVQMYIVKDGQCDHGSNGRIKWLIQGIGRGTGQGVARWKKSAANVLPRQKML